MGWDELELGDHVQVKDETMHIYTHGTVVSVHPDGTYDVEYDVRPKSNNSNKLLIVHKTGPDYSQPLPLVFPSPLSILCPTL